MAECQFDCEWVPRTQVYYIHLYKYNCSSSASARTEFIIHIRVLGAFWNNSRSPGTQLMNMHTAPLILHSIARRRRPRVRIQPSITLSAGIYYAILWRTRQHHHFFPLSPVVLYKCYHNYARNEIFVGGPRGTNQNQKRFKPLHIHKNN